MSENKLARQLASLSDHFKSISEILRDVAKGLNKVETSSPKETAPAKAPTAPAKDGTPPWSEEKKSIGRARVVALSKELMVHMPATDIVALIQEKGYEGLSKIPRDEFGAVYGHLKAKLRSFKNAK